MKTKTNIKVSNKIYEQSIKQAFLSNAGELDPPPDPQAIIEVQKAAINFVIRLLEKANIKDSTLKVEDLVAQFQNQPKYLDLCMKKLIYFNQNNRYNKNKRLQENMEKEDSDEDIQEAYEQGKEDIFEKN